MITGGNTQTGNPAWMLLSFKMGFSRYSPREWKGLHRGFSYGGDKGRRPFDDPADDIKGANPFSPFPLNLPGEGCIKISKNGLKSALQSLKSQRIPTLKGADRKPSPNHYRRGNTQMSNHAWMLLSFKMGFSMYSPRDWKGLHRGFICGGGKGR
ncbi:hypothetical protein CDAR_203581 [Caerostris darwini]|uniref:Uncharacterized protein n=1 Tax=Caerostris darwini TaxID=1538125 RepID=A0AAV4TSE4_9ARAC|nr:hypothetical protein CDAR_203581 [Caerostris darwini]